MEIKLLISLCGPAIAAHAGDTITVDADEGARLVASGAAEILRSDMIETATAAQVVEKAVSRKAKSNVGSPETRNASGE